MSALLSDCPWYLQNCTTSHWRFLCGPDLACMCRAPLKLSCAAGVSRGLRWLSLTRRSSSPVGPVEKRMKLLESQQIAFVRMIYPPKWISRPTSSVVIAMGNHEVSGVDGPFEDTDRIVCLHAPLRSRSCLEQKADQGRRVEEVGCGPGVVWHVRRFLRLQEEQDLDQEWAANSYVEDYLDVYGTKHPVVYDSTIRDIVGPWIQLQLWQRFVLSHR